MAYKESIKKGDSPNETALLLLGAAGIVGLYFWLRKPPPPEGVGAEIVSVTARKIL